MSREGLPSSAVSAPEGNASPEGYTDEYFRNTYGLTLEEANMPVRYQDYVGTMGQMLTDPGCPVGADFQTAHQEGGREAVIERLSGYQVFFGDKFRLGEDGTFKAEDLPKAAPLPAEAKKKVN